MGKLDGKIAVVTGAGRGIGRGIARGLAAEGAFVVLAARSTDQLADAVTEITGAGGQATAIPTDVTEEGQVRALFQQVRQRFGRLDIQVNNAGAFDGGPLDSLSLEAWNKVIAVNLTGPFLCTREALRIMKPQGGGRIINVGSISAQRVRPNAAPYGASKHGLWGLTQVTALEGREYGVTCGCLHPGNVRVERRSDSGRSSDEEPMMEVDEIAQAAVLMATLPPHVNMLEAIVLPMGQLYVGRG